MKYTLAAGVIAYLVCAGKLKWSDASLHAGNLPWIGIGLILLALVLAVSAVRYWLLMRAVGIRLSPVEVVRVVLISGFFNNFMLGSVGGDVVKIAYVLPASPSRSAAVSSVMVERLLGMLGLIAIGALSLLLGRWEATATPGLHRMAIFVFGALYGVSLSALTGMISLARGRIIGVGVWLLLSIVSVLAASELVSSQSLLLNAWADHAHFVGWVWGLLAINIGIALVCVLVVPGFEPGREVASFFQANVPFGTKFVALAQSVLSYRRRLSALTAAFALSLVIQFLNVLALYQFARAVSAGSQISVSHVFFAGPLALIANMLPVPGGGLGVGEAAFGQLLELCRSHGGAPILGGAAMFLSYRVWNLLVSLTGLPVYLWSGVGSDQLRSSSATVPQAVAGSPVPLPHPPVEVDQSCEQSSSCTGGLSTSSRGRHGTSSAVS